MRIAMVTLWDGEVYGEIARMVNPGKKRYCRRNGYDYHEFKSALDPSRPVSWSKVLAVRKILSKYDWVLWCDADTVLWNDAIGLRRFVVNEEKHFIVQENHQAINLGVFLLRNCRWSFDFLEALYGREDLVEHPWWEQQAAIEARDLTRWGKGYRVYPFGEPERGFHGYFFSRDRDTLLLHFAGIPVERRRELIENTVRLSKYPLHLRAQHRSEFPDLLNRLGLLGRGVHVASGPGEYSKWLLDIWEGRELWVVSGHEGAQGCYCDPYVDRLGDVVDECDWRNDFRPHWDRIRVALPPLKRTTVSDQCDFVYLDSSQTYEEMAAEISVWWPRVRAGGMLAGHNFFDSPRSNGSSGIKQAVLEFEEREGVSVASTLEDEWPSWYVLKPGVGVDTVNTCD